jgi:hypothetical protein
LAQWCLIDPNLDLVFLDGNRPLGAHQCTDTRSRPHNGEARSRTEFQRPRLASSWNPILKEPAASGLPPSGLGTTSCPGLSSPPPMATRPIAKPASVRNRNEAGRARNVPLPRRDSYFAAPPPAVWRQ